MGSRAAARALPKEGEVVLATRGQINGLRVSGGEESEAGGGVLHLNLLG